MQCPLCSHTWHAVPHLSAFTLGARNQLPHLPKCLLMLASVAPLAWLESRMISISGSSHDSQHNVGSQKYTESFSNELKLWYRLTLKVLNSRLLWPSRSQNRSAFKAECQLQTICLKALFIEIFSPSMFPLDILIMSMWLTLVSSILFRPDFRILG